jgi:hypothetical protein
MEHYFNVALNGRHLFRTDVYESEQAARIQIELIINFRKEDGYTIERSSRDPVWSTLKVGN